MAALCLTGLRTHGSWTKSIGIKALYRTNTPWATGRGNNATIKDELRNVQFKRNADDLNSNSIAEESADLSILQKSDQQTTAKQHE